MAAKDRARSDGGGTAVCSEARWARATAKNEARRGSPLGPEPISTQAPDDPRIDADLDRAWHADARRFEGSYRGRVAGLDAAELSAAAVDGASRASRTPRSGARQSTRSLLFASRHQRGPRRHGALLQHVQERGTEIKNALIFFELEWVNARLRGPPRSRYSTNA